MRHKENYIITHTVGSFRRFLSQGTSVCN